MEYKGIYYGDEEKVQRYYEGGAHFKYSQLYKILSLLAEQKEKESKKNDKLLSSSKKISNKQRNIIFNINQANRINNNKNKLTQYKTIINTSNLNNNKNISFNDYNQLSSLIINNYFMNKQIIRQSCSSERSKSFHTNKTKDSFSRNYKPKPVSRNIKNLSQGKLNTKNIVKKKNTTLNFNSYHKTQNSKNIKDITQLSKINNFLVSRIKRRKENKLNETSIRKILKNTKNNLSASNSTAYGIFTKKDINKNIKLDKIKSPKFKKITSRVLLENSKEYNESYTKAKTKSISKKKTVNKIKTKNKKSMVLSKINTKSDLLIMHIHDYLLNELKIWNKTQMNKKNSKNIGNNKINNNVNNNVNNQRKNKVKNKNMYDNILLNFKNKKSRNYKNDVLSNRTTCIENKSNNMTNNRKNFNSQIYCPKNSTIKKFRTSKNNKYKKLIFIEKHDNKNSSNDIFGGTITDGNKVKNEIMNTGFKLKKPNRKIINGFSEKRAWNPMKLMSLNDIRIFKKKNNEKFK